MSTGEQAEWIRLRLEGGRESFDLLFGDRIRVDDLELHPGGEEHADDAGVGRPTLQECASRAFEAVITFPAVRM